MKKLLEITDCKQCDRFYFHHKKPRCGETKRVLVWDSFGVPIPSWCPLPSAPNNKCTCERCTGLPLDSFYEDQEDVPPEFVKVVDDNFFDLV